MAHHAPIVVRSKTQLGEGLEIAFRPGLAANDPEHYLDYALALPGRIAEADRKQVVVFFDEFQEIASAQQPYGDPGHLTKRMFGDRDDSLKAWESKATATRNLT